MKLKKEKIEKTALGILTIILILYISFTLIFFSLFHISEKFLNKQSIYDFVSNINITDMIIDELDNEIGEFSLIKDDLNDIGISTEGINEFINSEEVKKFSVEVVTSVFNKVANKGNIDYKITNNELNELVQNNIDKLEINSSIDGDKLLAKLESKIPNLVSNINQLLDDFCYKLENSETFQKYENYIYNFINILDIIYNEFVSYIIIFIIVSLITLLIFIRKSVYKSLKWLSASFIIPTLIFGIISTFIFTYMNINNNLINSIFNLINNELIKHSIIYFIISFVFIILNIIAYVVKKYKRKKDVSYE